MINYDLDILFFSNHKLWKLERILEVTNLDKEKFYRMLEEFNQKLEKQSLKKLEYKNGFLAIPDKVENFEETRYSINQKTFILTEVERRSLIYLLIFINKTPLSIALFQTYLQVSKNTILSDLKKLREELMSENIQVEYSRKKGFYLNFEEKMLQEKAWYFLQNLSEDSGFYILSKVLNDKKPLTIFKNNQLLKKMMQELQIEIVYSRYLSTLLFACLLRHRTFEKNSENINDLLKSLINGMSDGKSALGQDNGLYRMAFNIMENVMKLSAIEFDDFTKTFMALLAHLTPAYYRIRNHFELKNVLLERIKNEYHSLFLLMDNALRPLKDEVGEISESEKAYFVILFGGEIYKNKYSGKSLKAIVLCVNGISSSLIMQKRLESLFPTMEFILSARVSHFEKLPINSYDIIFSTVPLKSDKKVYLMSIFPDQREENKLYNQVLQDFQLPGFAKPSAQTILDSIEPYIIIKDPVNRQDLIKIIEKKLNRTRKEGKLSGVMLTDLLTKEKIRFTNKELSWQEAIELAAQPLLDKHEIEERYIKAIIDKVEAFGPYIDLGLGIALPHARPEEGVKKLGMSFLRCEHPVKLMDDVKHEIKLFIVLAAIDNETHLRALSTLTKILSNKERLSQLLTATNAAEVEQILLEEEGEK
ncbi:BglG family transcription antiterminator [Lactococcus cremoris]|uniref:Ascorbate-specific PTS system EIIA component n=2 Tax=Lactococcus lactis subsp. cremoris TaxID=1359 RepID=A0A084ACH7_LACLC|nr:PTS sugar transporter subunit IIA [Lactococcus cremoris]KEY63006.1 Transcriptional antiterminator, BglG family [Lactococcus cremoris subsp. cremoris GE214]KKW73519.1 PTS IIA-like nitrogen-regulatory protein PtsN, ptsN [Lactococcus cremoris]TNU80390.1 PRD domain-containing protein [Lactococcus cremoris]